LKRTVSRGLAHGEGQLYQVDQPVSLSDTNPPSDGWSARLRCLPEKRLQRLGEICDKVCRFPLQLHVLLNLRHVHIALFRAVLAVLGYHRGRGVKLMPHVSCAKLYRPPWLRVHTSSSRVGHARVSTLNRWPALPASTTAGLMCYEIRVG
jgi:hypothetical protein